jgi:hypothetical protein
MSLPACLEGFNRLRIQGVIRRGNDLSALSLDSLEHESANLMRRHVHGPFSPAQEAVNRGEAPVLSGRKIIMTRLTV